MPPSRSRPETVDVHTPDAIEPLVGWRAWVVRPSKADHASDSLLLHSVAYTAEWPAGVPLHAHCRLPRNACRETPGTGCRCGIYALHQPVDAYRYIRNPRRVISGTFSGVPIVLGEVALWGRVVVGVLGWRGEYGYPRRLFVLAGSSSDDYGVARRLEGYRVPVSVASRAALFEMVPDVPRHDGPVRTWLNAFRRVLE